MSIPSRIAVHDFKEILTKQQNLKLEANIRYKSGRFYYLNNNLMKVEANDFYSVDRYFITYEEVSI